MPKPVKKKAKKKKVSKTPKVDKKAPDLSKVDEKVVKSKKPSGCIVPELYVDPSYTDFEKVVCVAQTSMQVTSSLDIDNYKEGTLEWYVLINKMLANGCEDLISPRELKAFKKWHKKHVVPSDNPKKFKQLNKFAVRFNDLCMVNPVGLLGVQQKLSEEIGIKGAPTADSTVNTIDELEYLNSLEEAANKLLDDSEPQNGTKSKLKTKIKVKKGNKKKVSPSVEEPTDSRITIEEFLARGDGELITPDNIDEMMDRIDSEFELVNTTDTDTLEDDDSWYEKIQAKLLGQPYEKEE